MQNFKTDADKVLEVTNERHLTDILANDISQSYLLVITNTLYMSKDWNSDYRSLCFPFSVVRPSSASQGLIMYSRLASNLQSSASASGMLAGIRFQTRNKSLMYLINIFKPTKFSLHPLTPYLLPGYHTLCPTLSSLSQAADLLFPQLLFSDVNFQSWGS